MQNNFLIRRSLLFWLGIYALLSFSACSVNKRMAGKVKKEFKNSAILQQYHTGFMLYDPEKKENIFEKDASRYFIPASNTKLFTFYAGLKLLGDSVPALRYIERGDSLIFWGTGDPSFLHSRLKGTNAYDFLKTSTKKLYFSPGRYTGDFYGNGWQWDDYNDYYQAEINELPIMDNEVLVSAGKNGKLSIIPQAFASCFATDSSLTDAQFKVIRDFNDNVFKIPAQPAPAGYNQQVPYKVSTNLTLELLIDSLKKPVAVTHEKMPANARTLYNVKTDSLFKQMLLPSDNFIAEQLLLVCGDRLGEELRTTKTIDYVEKNYLSSLPQKIRWMDGSGLSRMNLFTPADMVTLLDLIYKEVNNRDRLFSMLPAGGKSGTLRNTYPRTNEPFVFGKTGSLSNNHNQSGYLLTKKGKVLIFSFMNNNFVLPTADVRKEMVRVMTFIHDNY